MARFNITIILACVLLAMLLWIVRATVGEWVNPEPLVRLEEAPAIIEFDPALPVINDGAALLRWLADNRVDATGARALLRDFHEWLRNRGFAVDGLWHGAVPGLPADSPAMLSDNDAELITLAGAGDAAAAMRLGERSVADDPQAALEWFDQAIVNGSIFAMLRTADLLTTLGDPALAEFQSGPVWQQALETINQGEPPLERALAWRIAAVLAGGYSVLDANQADRILGLAAGLDAARVNNACDLAQSYVLDTAMARRARGGAVFSTERPLFALSVADPAAVLPCDLPLQPLVTLSDCIRENFVGPGQRLWLMYFCPSP